MKLHKDIHGLMINKVNNNSYICMLSMRSPFFCEDDFIVTITDDYISFKKPTIDYNGKTHKVTKQVNTYHLTLYEKLPIGVFVFDEEYSNEDELIVYFEKNKVE
jgi:hypothetical protein